jgi:hypothetical protein
LVPAGLFGNILGQLGNLAGGAVGGDAGRIISGVSSGLGGLLPFQAGPQMMSPWWPGTTVFRPPVLM